MNIQVDPTSSNLASAMLNSKIRPRAFVGYGVKIFHSSPPNYVTRSPGLGAMANEMNDEINISASLVVNIKFKIKAKCFNQKKFQKNSADGFAFKVPPPKATHFAFYDAKWEWVRVECALAYGNGSTKRMT